MKRTSFNVVDYDYTKHIPDIDYSEKITEPGLVLSMREIYQRYAAQGIDLLSGELVPDNEEPEQTEFIDADDNVDILQAASVLRDRNARAMQRSARRTAKGSDKEPEKPKDVPKTEKPKQSEGDDGKGTD